MRIVDLLSPLAWHLFPEGSPKRFWGQTTIPHSAFSAACPEVWLASFALMYAWMGAGDVKLWMELLRVLPCGWSMHS